MPRSKLKITKIEDYKNFLQKFKITKIEDYKKFSQLQLYSSTKHSYNTVQWGIGKVTQFCMSFIALWSQNGRFQTPQSCQFSN